MAGSDSATLTAHGRRPATDPASINLTGTGVAAGAPDLSLSPGTFIGGTTPKNYNYTNGLGNWSTTFTVTNNGTGTSNMLQVIFGGDTGFSFSNNTCEGQTLAPSATCTFDLTFTAPAGCNPGDPFPEHIDVFGVPDHYIHLEAQGFCSP